MIALAITSFAMTLSVVIYLNIQQSSMPFFKIKAVELANKCLLQSIQTKDFTDKEFEEQDFYVKKRAIKNSIFSDCYDLRVKIFDADKKKLAEIQTTVNAE